MKTDILWRKFKALSADKTFMALCHPYLPHKSGAEFLRQILTMPKEGKTPLTYDEANERFALAYHEFCLKAGVSFEDAQAMSNNLVAWVSSQGYYIDLDHTEYTSLAGTQ